MKSKIALKSINGQILLKQAEVKLFANKIEEHNSTFDEWNGVIRILKDRKSKLEGEIKEESLILEKIKEEQKAVEKQRKEA